jgi:hypothetical protein
MHTRNAFATAGHFRLAALALAIALPVFVNAATDSPEGAPQATSASVYADAIGSSRFERSGFRVEQGYTVESGNLYTRDGKTGSLVVVRSPDGGVIAIVDNPGKRGLLLVDAQGKSTFKEDLPYDYMTPDTVESAEVSTPTVGDAQPGAMRYIDMLMAYSDNAMRELNSDPIAHALAQLESANLGLRNSRVEDLALRLAAVNVFDVSYETTGAGLSAWQSMLQSWRSLYGADVNAAYSLGGDAGGWGYVPGYTTVNDIRYSAAFRHEIGHNAGGSHCNDGNLANYKFGYNNGTSRTYLCGNNSPYYSTPAVNDASGNPLGNARTADMARVWRENAARMSGYNPELPGLRMMLVSHPGNTYGQAATDLIIPGGESTSVAIVALSQEVGPIKLVANGLGNSSLLSVKLLNAEGNDVTVRVRASRLKERCKSPMNVYAACTGPFPVFLRLEYTSIDTGNGELLPGYYNGLLELEAQSPDSDWKMPIKVAVSLRK